MVQIAYFYCTCTKRPYFYFLSKIWRHRRVPGPRFPIGRENFDDTWTFKADIAIFIFAWIFRASGSKMATFRGKTGKRVGRYWPPTNSFLLFGVYTSVSNLVKIDKGMRPWVWRHTDRQRDRQTDANWFYYLSHAICYNYGADNRQMISHNIEHCRFCWPRCNDVNKT